MPKISSNNLKYDKVTLSHDLINTKSRRKAVPIINHLINIRVAQMKSRQVEKKYYN